jgi:nucleotide-binding universal stress UspA family protein
MASRPVVVAVDGSEDSLRAAEWAAIAARKHRATLRIVSVPAALPRLYAVGISPEMAANALRGLAARALAAALLRVRAVAPDLHVDTGLLRGAEPFAVAEAGTGAAMLVVGARGAGGFESMMLGSVSRYASAHAPCPVVVVREPEYPDRRVAHAAAQLAASEAASPGTFVTIVLPHRRYAPVSGHVLHDRTADKIVHAVSQVPDSATVILPFDAGHHPVPAMGAPAGEYHRPF